MPQHDILEYVSFVVDEFATRQGLPLPEAYAYLRRYGAVDFLMECYEAEHTLSIDDAVADCEAICKRNGGRTA